MLYQRFLKPILQSAFEVSPVTLLIGPRQTGKTTLMKEFASEFKMHYITLDTLSQLAAAEDDPEGFIAGVKLPVILDEVQRVPQLALPIKQVVDEHRHPGMFGLTGSANPLVAPKLNDSLAGRMFILHMWPLSFAEILGKPSLFLDKVFNKDSQFVDGDRLGKEQLIHIFSSGGYPDALKLERTTRDLWYDNLLTTIVERDVQDITNLSKPQELLRVLKIISHRVSSLLNVSELGRTASIPYSSLCHYMLLLESLFMIVRQPAWHLNKTKRLIKMPKIYFGDTGLLVSQLGMDFRQIIQDGRLFGAILENFVFLEIKKYSSWSQNPIQMYHYRTQTGSEVDLVLENRRGEIVGIEVKSSESIKADDFKGLEVLKNESGEKMLRGIVLYPGKQLISFSKDMIALPLSNLWGS